jgi:hypothetical protein
MKLNGRVRIDWYEIVRLARRAEGRLIEALDKDNGAEWRDVPPDVRRTVHNSALERVLEVVNMPDAILCSVDGCAEAMLRDYAGVCESFQTRLMSLCSDLHQMHPYLARSVSGNNETSGVVGSLPDSSGPVRPEESGFTCVDCRRSILEGEPMWSVNVHREIFENGAISVLQADCYLVLCEPCAAKRDFGRVHVPNVAA